MDFNFDEFWDRIKNISKEKGYTQKSLSVELGYTPRTIETWIHQKTIPNAYQLWQISNKLGVSMEYLVTGKPRYSEAVSLLRVALNLLS